MWVGVPYVPVSTAYSLVSQDYGKLRHILALTTPGLVFAPAAPTARPSRRGVRPMSRWCSPKADGRSRRHAASASCWPPRPPTLVRRARARRARHHRQVPVHLGLDQAAQGRDQHPAHAVRQPADAAPVPALPGRRAAGAGRLAALEPHLRRQPQHRHRAVQRRHAVHRRRQAHARGIAETCATCARSRPTVYFNVPKGFEEIAAAMDSDSLRCAHAVQPLQGLHVRRRRLWPGGVGQLHAMRAFEPSASACASSPGWA
jgi:feruloyl-CoA synthase